VRLSEQQAKPGFREDWVWVRFELEEKKKKKRTGFESRRRRERVEAVPGDQGASGPGPDGDRVRAARGLAAKARMGRCVA